MFCEDLPLPLSICLIFQNHTGISVAPALSLQTRVAIDWVDGHWLSRNMQSEYTKLLPLDLFLWQVLVFANFCAIFRAQSFIDIQCVSKSETCERFPSLGGMLLGVPPALCWSKLVCAINYSPSLYWQKFFPGFWTSELDCQPQTLRNSEGYEEHWIPSKNLQHISESITVAPDLVHKAWSWPCTGVASEAAHMSSEGEKSTSFRFRMFQQQGPWI